MINEQYLSRQATFVFQKVDTLNSLARQYYYHLPEVETHTKDVVPFSSLCTIL